MSFPPGTVWRPVKELRAFRRVHLAPGEATTVRLTLDPRDLAYFDEAARAWVAPPGTYEVLVGANARDIRLRGRFEFQEERRWAPGERFRW